MNSEGKYGYPDRIYNITYAMDDYVNPMAHGKLNSSSVRSCTSDLGEALENWQNRLHEVSMQRCTKITKYMRWVGIEVCDIPNYEGFPKLESFLTKFEEKVTKTQLLLALDFALQDTLIRWWVAHK